MISKAGSRTYERTQCPPRHPRLSPMERCLLKWAVIDRDDRVLDVGLGNGLMAEYLLRNMECEVCGVADDMELVRSTRGLVRSADLVYAAAGDIPWRDQAFHTVLLRPSRMDGSAMENQLREVHRVLKEGGQLVMGMRNLPAPLQAAMDAMSEAEEETESVSRRQMKAMLSGLGFEQMSWHPCGIFSGALVAWKRNPLAERFQKGECE
ncbi:MAG: class I SAM-dependent methyltransferase [Clostridiales bacterium]|nr:class I SAM-dependent methyltransferase [Clostridiales bacterium]